MDDKDIGRDPVSEVMFDISRYCKFDNEDQAPDNDPVKLLQPCKFKYSKFGNFRNHVNFAETFHRLCMSR